MMIRSARHLALLTLNHRAEPRRGRTSQADVGRLSASAGLERVSWPVETANRSSLSTGTNDGEIGVASRNVRDECRHPRPGGGADADPRRAGAIELCGPHCRHSPAWRRSASAAPQRARGSCCGRAHACGGARERWSRGVLVTRAYSPTAPALNWAFARRFAVPIRLQSLHNYRDLRRGRRRAGACGRARRRRFTVALGARKIAENGLLAGLASS
jgi:hypothetical protein